MGYTCSPGWYLAGHKQFDPKRFWTIYSERCDSILFVNTSQAISAGAKPFPLAFVLWGPLCSQKGSPEWLMRKWATAMLALVLTTNARQASAASIVSARIPLGAVPHVLAVYLRAARAISITQLHAVAIAVLPWARLRASTCVAETGTGQDNFPNIDYNSPRTRSSMHSRLRTTRHWPPSTRTSAGRGREL